MNTTELIAAALREDLEDDMPSDLLRETHRHCHGSASLSDVIDALIPDEVGEDLAYGGTVRGLLCEALGSVDWTVIAHQLAEADSPDRFAGWEI